MVRISATIAVLVFFCAFAAGAQNAGARGRSGAGDSAASAAIRRVLDMQVAAWNRGDIDGFMEGYARSNETTFVSGDTVTRGWQTVLERYKSRYDSRDKMGTLRFSELETKLLGRDTASALGRWQLTRAGESRPFAQGRFTLLFRRAADGWRIVHDHTSSAS